MSKNRVVPSSRGAADASAPNSRFLAYLLNHAQVVVSSLGKLYRTPVSTLMTVAVIGIALAFPTGLYVLLQNLQVVSGGWNGATQISLFAKMDINDEQAADLGQQLRQMPEIDSLHVLTRDEAMHEFQALSGFGEALEVLENNPLPAVLIIHPDEANSAPAQVSMLVEKLRALPEIELAQLDMQWVERLYTMMEIGERGILVIAALLALAVLLTIGNTIRLDIQGRRDEIVIIKLIGATDAFIRRPFLYTGLWYGVLGGGLSWLMVEISLGILSDPVQRLAGLYGSSFSLSTLELHTGAGLLAVSILLGLIGSWIAVSRHLHEIEPS
jgi:cell division transport system permease protein